MLPKLLRFKLFSSASSQETISTLVHRRLFSVTSSTDANEVNKFNKFSNEFNWHTSELVQPLRTLNKLRIPLIRDQLLVDVKFEGGKLPDNDQPLKRFNLLDIGCGGGLLSECLARLGANVTAIDANEHNIKFANDHLKQTQISNAKLNYQHSDLDSFAINNASQQKFDGIIASEILEHVDSVNEFIKNCGKLLKDDGLLFITTINQTVQSYLFAILLAENVLKLAPKNTHQYDKLVLLNGLCLILEENNLNVELVHGMRLNPITKEWSWCEDASMNYALVARKVNK